MYAFIRGYSFDLLLLTQLLLEGAGLYKKDFLKSVIVRLDFLSSAEISASSPPKSLLNAIKSSFGVVEKSVVQNHTIKIDADKPSTETTDDIRWVFLSENRKKQVVCTKDFVAIEYFTYEGFDNLCKEFELVLNGIEREFQTTEAKRLGLRYLDHIRIDEEKNMTSWEEYLKPSLLGGFSIFPGMEDLARALSVVQLQRQGYNIRFQYGMPNPDFPARIVRKLFILDTDVFSNNILDRSEVLSNLRTFHDECIRVFESVITEKLRERMGKSHGEE